MFKGLSLSASGIIFGAVIFTASHVCASENTCASSPLLVGQCFEIHGRLALYNGNPSVRIWQVGTKHRLGVFDVKGHPMENSELLPAKIRKLIPADPDATAVFGDYFVCPFERALPGRMQPVCIAGAKQLRSESPR